MNKNFFEYLVEYLVEFLGTFIFLSVIIINNNPFAIGLTLSAMIYFGTLISGGHFNPAVNLLMLINKKITTTQFIGQTIAQLLGAIAAYYYSKLVNKK